MSSMPPDDEGRDGGEARDQFVEFSLIERGVEHFADAKGHDEMFLGIPTPFPIPSADVAREIAAADDGSDKLHYQHFTIQMNRSRRMPMWTVVDIDGARKAKYGGRPGWSYDPRMDPALQTDDKVFSPGSSRTRALDRGHMVRRLDPIWGEPDIAARAQSHTFCLTNVCPQIHGFNDEEWGDLEDRLLSAIHNAAERAVVFTGPIFQFDDPLIADLLKGGPRENVPMPEIRVPRRFFKIIAWREGGKLKAAGFVRDQSLELEEAGPIQDLAGNTVLAALVTSEGEIRKGIVITDVQERIADIETMVGLKFPGLAEADTLAGHARQVLSNSSDAML